MLYVTTTTIVEVKGHWHDKPQLLILLVLFSIYLHSQCHCPEAYNVASAVIAPNFFHFDFLPPPSIFPPPSNLSFTKLPPSLSPLLVIIAGIDLSSIEAYLDYKT